MKITIVDGNDTGKNQTQPLGCGNKAGEVGNMILSLERFQHHLTHFNGSQIWQVKMKSQHKFLTRAIQFGNENGFIIEITCIQQPSVHMED